MVKAEDAVSMRTPGLRSDGHWADLEERGVYLGLRTMLVAFRLFGRFGFSLLLYPVIAYFFLTNGAARQTSKHYLSRVATTESGRRALGRLPAWRQSFRHFLCFGEAGLDKILAWTGRIRAQDLDLENEEAFEGLRRAGSGGVLIASHLGNVEVCRAIGTYAKGLRINVLVHTKHAENFNRLMREACPDSPVLLLQTTEIGPDTAMLLRERIERGEFVVIAGDRVPVSGGSWVSWTNFLGEPAPFPAGPFIMAALLGCPVLLLFCLKRGRRYRVIFEPFADKIDMPRASRSKVVADLVRRYAERLEHYCLECPYQWFNFFDFWRQAKPPAEPPSLRPT